MLSYACGPEAPVVDLTIGEALEETARLFPNREALIVRHQEARFTWAQLRDAAMRTARGLAGLGLQANDRVGVWSTNCYEWILLQYGCAMAGVVMVNVNPAYRTHELALLLKRSGIRALFLHRSDSRVDYHAVLEESLRGQETALRDTIYFGEDSWTGMLDSGVDPIWRAASPNDPANIQYTSGTTGSPKGVLLTHCNVVNNGRFIAGRLNATERDGICAPVPLYHCFGCVMGSMTCLASGAALILPSAQFDARAALEAVHEERATTLYGVPTMFIAELHHPDFAQFDLSSLRTGIMAGSPCPEEVMKAVRERMHCSEITIAYGQTESSPVITMSSVDDSVEIRCATVGCPLPATEVKIVSPTGHTVLVGEQGEICTRGYLVMKGYDKDPQATSEAINAEGWLHTGDLGVMREDGCFRMTGRAKDTIIRGGENIYPREVEEFLYTHPRIAHVQVLGMPDERLGETVLAWIQLKPGAEATAAEIRDFCRGKIAYFKIPESIRFVEAFPMTVSGKIQNFRIRAMEDRLRVQEAGGVMRSIGLGTAGRRA